MLHVNEDRVRRWRRELLATHVPLLRSVGVDADWQVMHGSDEFFAVTKAVHNGLQGADIAWTPAMQRTYLEKVLDNALLLEGHYDYVVVHDPQPAAMLSFLRERLGGLMQDTTWIWRCHIDLTAANPKVWEFFRPFVELHDASVWTMPEFVPASLDMANVLHAPPCIDPLSVKNLELAMPFCQELTRQYGVDVQRPIVCQVSRFDPWKDPVGVIEAFHIVRDSVPDAQPSCSRGPWPPTTPRGSRCGSRSRPRADTTATSTCCPTSTRSDRCRSTCSSAPPTSCCRSPCVKASGSP